MHRRALAAAAAAALLSHRVWAVPSPVTVSRPGAGWLSPMDLPGCVGDGVADDYAYLLAACQSGRPVDLLGRTYAIGTTLHPTSLLALCNGTVRVLSSAMADGLLLTGLSGFRLENLVLDLNGQTPAGGMNANTGLKVSNCTRFHAENVEVKNGAAIIGALFTNCSDFTANSIRARDFVVASTTQPIDEVCAGVQFSNCTRFSAAQLRARNLRAIWTGMAGTPADRRWSRGIAVGGSSYGNLVAPDVSQVGEGIDITGSVGNSYLVVSNPVATDCSDWGIKIAGSGRHSLVTGGVATRAGLAGFVVSGSVNAGTPMPEHVTFVGCKAINTGANGEWGAGNRCGFRLLSQSSIDGSYPRNVVLADCVSEDDQATPTTDYGAYSDVPLATLTPAGAGTVPPQGNLLRGFRSIGHIQADAVGFAVPVLSLGSTNTASWANAAWAPVDFLTAIADPSALHSTSSSTDYVGIREGGYYQVAGAVEFAANATGTRQVRLTVNNANGLPETLAVVPANPAGYVTRVTTNRMLRLNAGDYVKLQAYQDSGGALTLNRSGCTLSLVRVGP